MITINGDVYITNYGKPINEIVGEEFDFDYDDLDCNDDCELCDLCEDDDEVEIEFDLRNDERFVMYPQEYIDLLSRTVKEIYKTDGCPACIAEILDKYYYEG